MNVLILSNINSIHTKKWVISLAQRGINICVYTFQKNNDEEYLKYTNITIIEAVVSFRSTEKSSIKKILLLANLVQLLNIIRRFIPDIVHAHYATSYGLLGALTFFNPFILSVWGSDIYDFPKVSFIHRITIKFILFRADNIFSTSKVMAIETKKYTNKEIQVTPFGVDIHKFKKNSTINPFPLNSIILGTVKTLSSKYGVKYLIQSFKILKLKFPLMPLKLLIIGDGEDRRSLIQLTQKLEIVDDVLFVGNINNNLVPEYLNMMDIFVALSILDSESFGVAVVEASACEIPVVVSDVGGLPEVVENNISGFIVKSRDPEAAAIAIEKLILSKSLRLKMGNAGRERVLQNYNWTNNVTLVIEIYNSLIY